MKDLAILARNDGFALMEALIALAVAGLVSSAAAGATVLMRHIHDKAEHRRDLLDQTVSASRLIRTVMEKALPDAGRARFEDVGDAKAVRLYSIGPESLLLARPQHLRFHVIEHDGKSDLRLSWQDQVDGRAHDEVVLSGARSISFSYFGLVNEQGARAWKSKWFQPHLLPDGVLIQLDIPELGPPIDVVVKTAGALPSACLLLPHEKVCHDAGR